MSELPHRLSEGAQKVTYRPVRGDARGELRAALDREYVHVLFTETRGGTELGFRPDPARSAVPDGAWEAGEGSIHLEGELTLDGTPVRCVVDLDLRTMAGEGRLDVLEPVAGGAE